MINIRTRVKHLIQKYRTNDPAIIAAHLNIKISYEDLDVNTKGFYIKLVTNKFIVINQNLNETEKRVVLAHELGHAVLHNNKTTCFIREYTLFPRGKIEAEANKFAAELLINETELDKLTLSEICTNQLASYYGVPEQLIIYKFKGVKL